VPEALKTEQTIREMPLVTFVLVAYNHERYIKESIESALAQTYRPIQFIFSDDCSTDRTYELMCDAVKKYEGKENILLNRNEKNIGVVNHLNKLFMELADGKYFIQLGGDDITTPDRTAKVIDCFMSTGASMVAINPMMIDEAGVETGARLLLKPPIGLLKFDEYFLKGAPFFGGDLDRELFDVYGPMKDSARNEDRILPFRASTLGGIAYLTDHVYYYREHNSNMSFWVKMKRDPINRFRYETAFMRNELQNLANFLQEVRESYQGSNKNEMLTQIETIYNRKRFEVALLESGFLPQLSLVPTAFRIGRSSREVLRLLLICVSPKLYRVLNAIRQSLSVAFS